MYFFSILKNTISAFDIKKKIFFWKLVVALMFWEKVFCQQLSGLFKYWHCELHTEFQEIKILHFSFKILTKLRKITCLKITLISTPSYRLQWSLFTKIFFSKLINSIPSFHKKKIFIWTWEMIFFLYSKKIHDFCSKIQYSKYLQITKKNFTPWKSLEYRVSNDITYPTQTQEMTEILSNEKKVSMGGNILFRLDVVGKKINVACFEMVSNIRLSL